MHYFGPIYCETPDLVGAKFPVEPWNAYSSLAIILFAVIAAFVTAFRNPRAYALYFLCLLLAINGIGSFLWHGLRTRWALALDVFPALVFLLCFMFLWARKIFSVRQAVLVVLAFFLIQAGQRYIAPNLASIGIWVALAPAVILIALWLIMRTITISRRAAIYGSAALLSSLVGLAMRTLDRRICSFVPSGTHFLWHMLLSFGAFLGILTLITLDQIGKTPPRPVRNIPS